MTTTTPTAMQRENPYTRTQPVNVAIKERYSLCRPGSHKSTYHLVLDLEGIDFPYKVGDSVGIYCPNDPHLVTLTLRHLGMAGDEIVTIPRSEEQISISRYLSEKASITDFSRKFLTELAVKQSDPAKREQLEAILSDKERIKAYIASREVWDLLEENPEATFEPQEIVDLLMPNLPRFYSIASSSLANAHELHLTVTLTQYESHGHLRLGVCTHFLCNLAPLHEKILPIYLQPTKDFTLPEASDASLIMVGPGTGIAPFRGFMEERIFKKEGGRNWLFFGEWTRDHEYYYQDYWETLEKGGFLKVDTAFSRDQEEKVYVQHRMLENAQELYTWLEDGAYLYVCGDAQKMAKDVDAALHQIVEECSDNDPKEYVKQLRKEGRYLRDIY